MPPRSLDASLYDGFARYGSGVTLVTVRGDDDRFFIAAPMLTVSVDPFTVAISVGRHRDALSAIVAGSTWAISLLGAHHLPLARRLSEPGTRDERLNALEAAGADSSPEGPLWLPDALATFWCGTDSTMPVHDQLLVVGNVVRGVVTEGGTPLLRWNRDFGVLGGLPCPSSAMAS
ncbi:flavin reductase [Aeromicrobium sp. YIM 150415]|uniref:flavin reductase family protein n=1 Tax=Aeromicrobium sp. YIM 150415 TaxID=2803912 RepID=UPI00196531BB|nr:flavin reductase family protein [Aeromicrobium sp. YIM 150415]MBM9463547.1 flavin reductase [Aeromicrobium sp. YIM 150415]